MITMEEVKPLCTDETLVLTTHVRERMKKRGIEYSDLLFAVSNGEIIEQYKDDNPYPSCLVLGHTANNRPLHVVVSIGSGVLWVITSYCPAPEKWKKNFSERR